jgi:hypothetical protein
MLDFHGKHEHKFARTEAGGTYREFINAKCVTTNEVHFLKNKLLFEEFYPVGYNAMYT